LSNQNVYSVKSVFGVQKLTKSLILWNYFVILMYGFIFASVQRMYYGVVSLFVAVNVKQQALSFDVFDASVFAISLLQP